MSGRSLDAAWRGWLQENIARRCDPKDLLSILLAHRFSIESIRLAMGEHFPAQWPLMGPQLEMRSAIDHAAFSKVYITQPGKVSGAVRYPSDKVQLYTIDGFLPGNECDAIADLVLRNLRTSTVTIESPSDKYYRTSSTSDLSLIENTAIAVLDDKIARTIGIRPTYSEGIQGQHYAVGQEFKQHTDFFEPGTEEYATYAGPRGNRTWTFMVYLNDVAEGGGTSFLELGHTFEPRKGRAVVWNNLNADGSPNYQTLHAGLPVRVGYKVIITKWFRERGTGSIFF